ncbi:MAG: VOC family protein [Phyllobacterium sp.]|uniref:VOC family protein n=1 Tax=Phyllobacterium sp. TaxID=1871046 RepID=UPI0030F1734F
MHNPDFMLIYVADPSRSRRFYAELFERDPVEESPNFAMFALDSGLKFGMWSREEVEPAPTTVPGASELLFSVDNVETLESTHHEWSRRGLVIAQQPKRMDFGHTFVALDPDGHRLLVIAPE